VVYSAELFKSLLRNSLSLYNTLVKQPIFKSLHFRVYVLGFILSLVVATIFFISLQKYINRQKLKEIVTSEELSFANYLASVRDWFSERFREVQILSRNPIYKSLNLDQIHQSLVETLPSRQGPYLEYFVSDLEGNYTSSILRRPGKLPNKNFFEQISSGETVLSGYLISPATALPILIVAVPIFEEMKVVGAFGLTIDLIALHEFFRQKLLTTSNTTLFITDGDGKILWSNRFPVLENENIRTPSAIVTNELANQAELIFKSPQYQVETNGQIFFSGVIEGTPNFRFIKITQMSQLIESLQGLTQQLVLLSLLFFIVLLILVFLVNHTWNKHFVSMRNIFSTVATGDFSVIAPETGTNEMVQMAHGFNEMMHYIRRVIYYDSITELPNRTYFEDFVKKNLHETQFYDSTSALVVISIDKFKNFNDSHGSNQGDQLLKMSAKRIMRIISKRALISRGNGAEFNVFLYGFSKRSAILETLNQLLKDSINPYIINNEKIYLTYSIGVAFYRIDANNYDELMINSSIAKNSAKKSGGNQIKTFNESMRVGLNRQMQIEAFLHIAIEYNQFHQVYHPQVDARTHQIIGMEALIRWTSPELGPIPPSVFIPIAEESGMIKSIDLWSLLQACRQNKSWIDQGCMPTTVSVNISSIFLDQPDFIKEIKQILILTQHPPELLELEITERIALGGYDDVIRKLESLRNMGIKISIDDFGTGYSSLNYLQNLPIQRIKIDQSFVRDLPHNQQVIGIVNTIISMGNHFGLELIAEGVENHQQLSFFVKQGCHFIQGYYYSKPLTHAEMQQLLYKGIIHPNGKH